MALMFNEINVNDAVAALRWLAADTDPQLVHLHIAMTFSQPRQSALLNFTFVAS